MFAINIDMDNNLVDKHIYDSCVGLGLCQRSNYSFSRLIGRTPSYFSTISLTGKSLSADSLLRLSHRLSQEESPPVKLLSDFVRSVALDRAGIA